MLKIVTMNLLFSVLYFVSIVFVNTQKVSYDGHKLYKITPHTEEQVKHLQYIQEDGLGTFWEEHFGVNNDVKIMVDSDKENEFLKRTKTAGMDSKLVMENLQRVIDDQLKSSTFDSRDSTPFHGLTWDQYNSLEQIYAWLDELAEAYPNIVTPVVIGNSFENRPIRGIVLNYYPTMSYPNAGVIESTIHAREWIAPATVTWVIKEFLTSTDPEIREMAENFEWHIFPVVNPDGYSYTFTNNRMWRKNRNTSYFTSCNATGVDDDMSNGVDLNRNFDFVWNTAGTSPDPCNNLYPGPSPASEPETRAIVQYVQNLNQRANMVYYLAFHSYTQLVIIPFSHINGFEAAVASNYADMYEVGIRGADRLRQRYGTEYRVGVSPDVMYAMSGTSFDWVKFETQLPISYLLELRDMGDFGFLLPPQQIIPSGLETMDFLLEMNKNARSMGLYYGPMSSATSVQSFSAIIISIALMMMFT